MREVTRIFVHQYVVMHKQKSRAKPDKNPSSKYTMESHGNNSTVLFSLSLSLAIFLSLSSTMPIYTHIYSCSDLHRKM